MTATENIFNRFWESYVYRNPSAKNIFDLFTSEGEHVAHDHIALRTFNDPRVNLDVIARIFIKNGYEAKGTYEFNTKHLSGRHYEHATNPDAPKVFVSELLLEKFSKELQQTVKDKLDSIPQEIYQDPDLVFSGSIWGQLPFKTYETLRQESEYAAWTLVYGYRANHFAINVNKLANFRSLQEVNTFVKSHGYLMNTSSGGEIYGTPEELLEQSATKSEIVPMEFSDGTFEIPACFYEFTLRHKGADGKLYSGFIAANADKIFESTNYYRRDTEM